MLINLEMIILQAAPGFGGVQMLIMIGMIGVMYFFMIRPQAKRAKEQKKFAETIGPGEKIVTNGGIHGTIKNVKEDGTLLIEVHHGHFLTIERNAVSMEMTNAHKKKTAPVAVEAAKS